ncbi:hypothetical protein N0V85_007699 [Neofusicoccum parvum]|uniref:Uncharacterized protein n=1 Tax=Neofusicoccum parvum TaxID=310453 RepID=A0ACB5SPI8_9PEZI|nr:hypothetical protein N0V85_007699 [Neofusicoccum parvum]
MADIGMITILPPKMANEIRNDPRLNFFKTLHQVFHAELPGFEGFKESSRDTQIVQQVLMKELTKHLDQVTEPLAEETALALDDISHADQEWHQIELKNNILQLIARISSHVFLGEQLCRNEEWLTITKEYTTSAIAAAEQLRSWPGFTRLFVHWFLPRCRKLRMLVKKARAVIGPVVEQRRKEKLALKAEGNTVKFNDAIEWFERTSGGRYYDPANAQLFMSTAAINSTTDLICQVMTDLAQHPDVVEALREEAVTVVAENGWKKVSLYKMKLLDSVLKESQRLKPIATVSMRRLALEDVKLSDGTLVRKGQMLAVSSHLMWDPREYDKPYEWDGYRFYRMRHTPGKENVAQFVSTNPNHLGFGHGIHACPGRFFTANEAKIALIHILLKYDWRLLPGSAPKPRPSGIFLSVDPLTRIEIRRRQEEVKL